MPVGSAGMAFVLAILGLATFCEISRAAPPMDEQERAIAIRKAFEHEKKKAAPRSPYLGMTPAQAVGSNWGKPSSVNRTQDSAGNHEQWVYGNSGHYLYFDNSELTSIQTAR